MSICECVCGEVGAGDGGKGGYLGYVPCLSNKPSAWCHCSPAWEEIRPGRAVVWAPIETQRAPKPPHHPQQIPKMHTHHHTCVPTHTGYKSSPQWGNVAITDARAQTARWEYEREKRERERKEREKITSIKSTETALKKHNALLVQKEWDYWTEESLLFPCAALKNITTPARLIPSSFTSLFYMNILSHASAAVTIILLMRRNVLNLRGLTGCHLHIKPWLSGHGGSWGFFFHWLSLTQCKCSRCQTATNQH